MSAALERAERALVRVERAVSERGGDSGRDDELRSKVRDAIAELDELIREASR